MGRRADVGVVARRPRRVAHLCHLTHRHQLVERVVDGGQRDLGEDGAGPLVHLVGGQVDVVPVEGLGDGAPLRRHPPPSHAQAGGQQRWRRGDGGSAAMGEV